MSVYSYLACSSGSLIHLLFAYSFHCVEPVVYSTTSLTGYFLNCWVCAAKVSALGFNLYFRLDLAFFTPL
ncbi:hypothetical protein K439DRAFT_515157 [Ramaria rubella]|nr:hypothetical protein K439DRAFT_515157 [Ramaria rubella]